MVNKIRNYIIKLGLWIWEGKYPLLIPIITSIFFINKLPECIEDRDYIRYYGWLLQLIGTCSIAYGLKDKLVEFKKHGFCRHLIDHLKSIPRKIDKNTIELKAKVSSKADLNINMAVLSVKPNSDDLEKIIKYFEDEIQNLRVTVNDIKKETKNEIDKLNTELSTIKNKFSNEIKEINRQVSEIAVDNIWLEFFGFCCLLLGLTLATIPDLIIKLI